MQTATLALEKTDLLEGLNEKQRLAVTHGDGPLLIIAGAGTGKTTVISKRVAWLIEQEHAKPEEILALTFTEKAATEMEERVDQLLPLGYVDLWISTFHSFCQRVLEDHAIDIGLPGDFKLVTQTDAYLLIRRNLDRFELDYYKPLGNPTKFVHSLLTHFSRAKDEVITPEEYRAYAQALPEDEEGETARIRELASAYATYQELLLEQGLMDFGDLQMHAISLLKKRPRILAKYREQFKYVIVDEFQDTNWAQYELVKLITEATGNLLVVGDDDQSIYKFRGASISNILQFKDDFPSSAEVVLTENYRSGQKILDLSYNFIQQNNPNRLEARLGDKGLTKRLSSNQESEGTIEHLHFGTLEEEVAGVIDRIVALKSEDPELEWKDFCLLARSNAGIDPFACEMDRRGVPYVFHALKGLYAKPIVLDCMAYFRLLDNYHESSAVYRILNSPPYRVSGEDLVTLVHEARRKAASLYSVVLKYNELELTDQTKETLAKLTEDIRNHTELAKDKPPSVLLVRFIYDSGYVNILRKNDTQSGHETVGYLSQLLDRIKRFETMHDDPSLKHFMEEHSLERESGDEGSLSLDVESGPDMIRLMTVHAAKGLEFRHVFVVGMVDKRFPTTSRGGEIELPPALIKEAIPEGDAHLEEERRLFYVAMTRAKEGLKFSSADDYGGKTAKKLSRFLAELGFEKPTHAPMTQALEVPPPVTENAPRKIDYTPPAYYSFTQLAAYASCPLQYKFAHLVRIPVFGKPALSFGKTMHAALEKFLDLVSERQAAGQTDELPVSREELDTIYNEVWQDDWYDTAENKQLYRERGQALLDTFYAGCVEEPPQPLYLEKDFKLKIGPHVIKGKIDRIDKVHKDSPEDERQAVEIIDYKTGKPKKDGKISADDKRQLYLYQIAVARLFGLRPVKLTYHYLEDGSRVSFIGKEKDIEKFEVDLEKTIAGISEGKFDPTPGMQCRFCDFQNICESAKLKG